MITKAYRLLKQHLTTAITELKHIDLDIQQYLQDGSDAVRIEPALYIKFAAIDWTTMGKNVQEGTLPFECTLITATRYGDERDLTDLIHINHTFIEGKVFTSLMNKQFLLSQLSEYAVLAGTENDRIILQSITREESQPHDFIDTFVTSSITFECTVRDYSACPILGQVLADLDLQAQYQE